MLEIPRPRETKDEKLADFQNHTDTDEDGVITAGRTWTRISTTYQNLQQAYSRKTFIWGL